MIILIFSLNISVRLRISSSFMSFDNISCHPTIESCFSSPTIIARQIILFNTLLSTLAEAFSISSTITVLSVSLAPLKSCGSLRRLFKSFVYCFCYHFIFLHKLKGQEIVPAPTLLNFSLFFCILNFGYSKQNLYIILPLI